MREFIQGISRIVTVFAFSLSLWGQPTSSGLERVDNPSLRLPLLPQLYNYHSVETFPGLKFDRPLRLTTPPGETERLFVVEQGGKIWVINNFDDPTTSLFLDLSERTVAEEESGLLNLAFHPDYANNGYFFVFYTLNSESPQGTGLHDRLARFQVSDEDPNRADPASETVLINQYDRGVWHNAGALAFGPDGYLYLTVGDEGGGSDSLKNSQTITKNFYSGIIRIDVDEKPGNLPPNPHPASVGNYLVPADNPYVEATSFLGHPINPNSVRTEFYAVGLRNAWRFSFDPVTGVLLCNDTGDFTREEVNLIEKGGNYGWAFFEGTHLGPRRHVGLNPDDFIPPLAEYGREQGNDIAAGLVYRGTATPELSGSFVFSDFWNGYLGRIDFEGPNAGEIEWLMWDQGIADMDVHPRTSEIIMADWFDGTIRTLVGEPEPDFPPLPAKLSETGLFQDLETLTPSPGVVPYDINVTFWSDNALKQRWFALPQPSQFLRKEADHELDFPTGMIWVKHFELELTPGDPSTRKRLETRVMVQTRFDFPYGVTYRWGNSTTDAELVHPGGLNETFTIQEESGPREQVWRYPSRRECISCHRSNNAGALGFSIVQLNCEFDYGNGPVSQLGAMNDAGYFEPKLENIHVLPALARLDDESASLQARARSYLYANCSSCHQGGEIKIASWDARYSNPLSQIGLVNVKPRRVFGPLDVSLIRPGSPEKSVLYERIRQQEVGRMPPIATSVLDHQGMELVRRWITESLAEGHTYADWEAKNFSQNESEVSHPFADPDQDQAINYLEYLTLTNPKGTNDRFHLQIHLTAEGREIRFLQAPRHYFEVQWAPSLGTDAIWRPLNEPENRPSAVSTTTLKSVIDRSPDSETRYYRVAVTER